MREVSPTPFMISGLPIPAAVRERLSAGVSDSMVARYRWLNERSRGLPDMRAIIASDDSPISMFRAKREKRFFFGSKLILTF